MADRNINLDVKSKADTAGIDKADKSVRKLEGSTKDVGKAAVKTEGLYKRAGDKIKKFAEVGLGPISALIGAIGLLSKGVDLLVGFLDRGNKQLRDIKSGNIAAYLERMADAYERQTRALDDAAQARSDLNAGEDQAIAAARELEAAQLALDKARALASADPDDALARERIEARFAERESEMGIRHGRGDISLDQRRLQAERDAREREAADLEASAQGMLARVPGALRTAQQEQGRERSFRSYASKATFGLVKSDYDPAAVEKAQSAADEIVAKAKEALARAEEARRAADQAQVVLDAAKIRAQTIDVAETTAGVRAGATRAGITRREREQRQAADRAAALDAARAAAEARQGEVTARRDTLSTRYGALRSAASDPAQSAGDRARFRAEAADLRPQLTAAENRLRELDALLRDESALIQRFAERTAGRVRQTNNALKRNDA